MVTRTLAVLLLLPSFVFAALADASNHSGSYYPAEINQRDLDRIAKPTVPVNTTNLATQLGITDTLVIWYKFKLNAEGQPSKIEVMENLGSDTAALIGQSFLETIKFNIPSGQNKRKTHYYGLIVCPDQGGKSSDTYRMRDFSRTKVDLDRAWQEALRSNGLTAEGNYPGCSDSAAMTNPEMTHMEEPTYPVSALSSGESGAVTVQCIVSVDGRVPAAHVLKSADNKTLDDSAIRAATACRFKPATCQGRKVPSVVSFTYTFRADK